MISFFQKSKKTSGFLWLVFLCFFVLPVMAGSDDKRFKGETRVYNTVRINSPKPQIDGILNDVCWHEGEWGAEYRQNMPVEAAPPSQKTMIKILYDNENIYVAIKAYDNEPDKIDRQMARRDEFSGDIVGVNFDSYFDHRTGFEFNLTAAGSKIDLILTNDGWDVNWNPVWDGKVGQMDSGWIAEMQIPLSQLRYSNQPVQVWGLHSWRWLNRNKEEDQWNLIPRDNAGVLYHFGELHGLENLPKISRVEFMPYTVAKVRTYEKEEGNPFSDGKDPSISFGLDGKMGIGSNFTIDYTVNPDFGQVEADPSELNLTAFETFFEEKRPFFIEGRNIFNFGFGDNMLLYSRRIGHTPSYEPDDFPGEYCERPDYTSILGAVKLTGKTRNGLSVGLLESLTAEEFNRISSVNADYKLTAEPLTNYFAGRIQKDINKSNTMIGGVFTSTYRNIDEDYLQFMNKSAVTGGFDLRHYLKNKTYYVDLKATGSHISGSAESITDLQQQSSRYYQRPGATHLQVDTLAKSLSGTGGSMEFWKCANGKWRYGIGVHWISPGLELNDMGFQNEADKIIEGQVISYVENTPKGIFRAYRFDLSEINVWSFGGEFLHSDWEFESNFGFENKWELHANVKRSGKLYDVALLRGGPGVYVFGETSQDYYLSTDQARKLSFGLGYENTISDRKVSTSHEFQTEVNWKITNSFLFTPQFSYIKMKTAHQFIENDDFADQNRYLLGTLDRNIYEFTFRLSYAITPVLTIQYYGSPYIDMGTYCDFKTLADAETKQPAKVFRSFGTELTYNSELNSYRNDDGVHPAIEFDNPDYNFGQFRSNLVVRWEYRPGSAIFLVWTHNRTSDQQNITNTVFNDSFNRLFNQHAENVFLIKFNYWFAI